MATMAGKVNAVGEAGGSGTVPMNRVLTGVVKAVLSGDTVVLTKPAPGGGAGASGPPKEIRLTLAAVRAPAMRAVGANAAGEEPFAFAAREALRTRTIGKMVQFVVEYTVPQLPGRYFGTVLVDPLDQPGSADVAESLAETADSALKITEPTSDSQRPPDSDTPASTASAAISAPSGAKVSVARELVRAGLLRVKPRGDGGAPAAAEAEQLLVLENLASADRLGVHGLAAAGTRNLVPAPPSTQLVHELRGRTQHGVVEYCITGSVYKVSLRDDSADSGEGSGTRWRSIGVQLAGAQAPGFRREPGAPVDAPAAPMPFALNARYMAEMRLLHREIAFVVEHADRVGGPPDAPLYVHISHVKQVPGAQPSSPPDDIAEALLQMGFAKTLPYSLAEMPSARAMRLRMAEKAARDGRRGVWRDFRPSESNAPLAASALGASVFARVQEVVSGDTLGLIVESGPMAGNPVRVFLASVRAPRLARLTSVAVGSVDEPYAYDAREFLRKKLIGKRVRVHIVYQKSLAATQPASGSQAPQPAQQQANVMLFASVFKEGAQSTEGGGGTGGFDADVAEMLVRAGLATVVKHRSGDDTALEYDALVEAEKAAKEARKGIHKPVSASAAAGAGAGGTAAPGVRRINDLTAPDAKKRAKDMLAFLEKAGAMSAVVEHASSGSRFRVYVPKDRMLLGVALRAVRAPAPTRRSGSGSDASEQGEPGGDHALAFARDSLLQRDVQLEVFGIDRNGTFLVDLWIVGQQKDAAEMLLEAGAAVFHESRDSNPRTPRYIAAEKRACSSSRGLWAHQSAPSTKGAAKANAPDDGAGATGAVVEPPSRVRVRVVEVGQGGRVFFREMNSEAKQRSQSVEQALAELPTDADSAANNAVPIAAIKNGEVLAAHFSNGWFRAKVLRRNNQSEKILLRFLDYGTEDWVPARSVMRFPVGSAASAVPPLANEARLAGIVVAGGSAPDAIDGAGAAGNAQPAVDGYDDTGYEPEALDFLREELMSAPWVELLRVGRANGVALCEIYPGAAAAIGSDADVGSGEIGGEVVPAESSTNQQLLRLGLARVIRRKDEQGRAAVAQYGADEQLARASHLRIWRYGDPYASDEDQVAPSSTRRNQ